MHLHKKTDSLIQNGDNLIPKKFLILPVFFFATFILFALIFPFQLLAEEGKNGNTLFLPLKINAPTEKEKTELTRQSDEILIKISEDKGHQMLSRMRAETKLDYDAWPPSIKTVLPLSPATINYVAAGSLTRLGDKISIDIVVIDLFD